MIAIEIATYGAPDGLEPTERPKFPPMPGNVLVKVEAAGVNRPDIMQRLGKYPPPVGASDIPGLEIAGVVVAAGRSSTVAVGQQVCALVSGGGYAEYCTVPAQQCLPIPSGVSEIEAAAI